MNNYNLLKSSKDLFDKLLSDFDLFKGDVSAIYKALDCALSAWHLTDWVYNEYERNNYPGGIGLMRQAFQAQCGALGTMHDIITNTKHFTVSKPQSDMTQGFNSFEDRIAPTITPMIGSDWLMIEFSSGETKTMYQLINEAVEFWTLYFEEK